jgi:hypothetical protein
MARVNNNPILQKLSGTLGETVTFKTYNGETYITKKPRPSKTESPAQKRLRDQFRMASQSAKLLLLDPEKKAYYTGVAKSRKLRNAYTAANQDALKAIHANPPQEELPQASAGEIRTNTVRNEGVKETNHNSNGCANIADELLGFGDPLKAPTGNATGLNQQLADATNAVQHCLLELQKAIAKASELMQAVGELNAKATSLKDAPLVDSPRKLIVPEVLGLNVALPLEVSTPVAAA